MSTTIQGSTVFVTGANGGLGIEFVRQALERGAVKVYASARTPREWDDARVIPIPLDVTDDASIAAAVAAAADASVLINNAGISRPAPLASSHASNLRELFETNFFGAVAVAAAFAPMLAANGGGVMLNVHSALSWIGIGGGYSATKAALWSATNSLRVELADKGTHVVGLHLGYTDTPMTANIDAPMNDPADIVRSAYEGIEAGDYEVLADELSVNLKQGLSGPIEAMYPQLVA